MSAHEFVAVEIDRYHCDICGSAMHCAHCNDGCGAQGHAAIDADGVFFTCEDAERTERWRVALMARMSKGRR